MLQYSLQNVATVNVWHATVASSVLKVTKVKVTKVKVTGLDYRQNHIAAGVWQAGGDIHCSMTPLSVIHQMSSLS